MTLLEEIYEAAAQAAPSGADEELLQRLCRISAAQWQAQLKAGVTPEDCREVFICAAAWSAAAGYFTQQSAASWNIESFTVGDVSVKTASGEKTAQQTPVQRLTQQAQLLMHPFCRAEDFAFVGVRG